MVDGLYINTEKRMMNLLAIALSWVEKRLQVKMVGQSNQCKM
jgi:hypothetical protein